MTDYVATNAASSGVRLDKKRIKQLSRRSDRPGLVWLSGWLLMLLAGGAAVFVSLGTWWIVAAMIAYGTVLTLSGYALSHETAHGTAFRTRWVNEALFWISSFIYVEEPYHRRYAHTRHHTYTWIEGKDAQMPFDTPLTFKGWLLEISGYAMFGYEAKILWENATGRFSEMTREFTPASELPKLQWGARAFLLLYAALAGYVVVSGHLWPVWFFFLPRLLGGPVMLAFGLIQHVEMEENQHSILRSTRSLRTNRLARFLYMNMNNHIEHHLYPMVPFHQLPALAAALEEQTPEPDPGFFRTNWEVLQVVVKRSLGRSTKAPTIRQAPHVVT